MTLIFVGIEGKRIDKTSPTIQAKRPLTVMKYIFPIPVFDPNEARAPLDL